jgi:hypothetical protein
MRIKLLCEGKTEQGLRILLTKAVAVPGCSMQIKTYKGVGALLRGLDGRIAFELRSGAQVVFCLVDYHHYPLPDNQKHLQIPQRLAAIKSDVAQRIDTSRRSKVRCHVIVHEVEAWILADEQALAQKLKIKNLARWEKPETINDINHPAKVLQELFRTRSPLKRRYDKFKDGVDLLQKVDWQKVYTKCPTFKQLVDDLRIYCQK